MSSRSIYHATETLAQLHNINRLTMITGGTGNHGSSNIKLSPSPNGFQMMGTTQMCLGNNKEVAMTLVMTIPNEFRMSAMKWNVLAQKPRHDSSSTEIKKSK